MFDIYPENAVILAPLAGHTDIPMRLACKRHGCRFAFTEMIDAGSLVYATSRKTMHLAMRDEREDFLGIQLVGSDPDLLRGAAEIVNRGNYDVLDFNLGCPAPKVAKKSEGISFILKRPDEAVRAAELLVRESRIPVTVKMRILDADDPAPTVAFAKRLENAGVRALTVHGRVMKMFYSGPVAFDVIRAVKENVKIPVIANGGAMDGGTIRELREKTDCSRIMIARGALGNPWIFEEAYAPEHALPPTVSEFADEIETHFRDMVALYGEEQAFTMGRKTLLEYLKGRGYPGTLRAGLSSLLHWSEFSGILSVIRQGPGEGYWTFLENTPSTPRKLRRDL